MKILMTWDKLRVPTTLRAFMVTLDDSFCMDQIQNTMSPTRGHQRVFHARATAGLAGGERIDRQGQSEEHMEVRLDSICG